MMNKEIDAKDIVEVIKNTKKIILTESKSVSLSNLITQPTLDSNVEFELNELYERALDSTDSSVWKVKFEKHYNTIKQAFSDKDKEIALLKRDVANNELIRKEAIRMGKSRLQSKLNAIEEIVGSSLCYIKSDNWYEALKEIKQIIGGK